MRYYGVFPLAFALDALRNGGYHRSSIFTARSISIWVAVLVLNGVTNPHAAVSYINCGGQHAHPNCDCAPQRLVPVR
jgi:hypothetical protein